MKEKSAFWSSSHATKIESVLLALLFLFLPTQLTKHFWPQFSLVTGIRVDYLSPTIYVTDILIGLLFVVWLLKLVIARNEAIPTRKSLLVQKYRLLRSARNDRWKYIFGFLALFFLSVNIISAERIGLSLYYLIKLFEFSFLAFYIAQNIQSTFNLATMALLFAISSFFQSLLALLQYFQQGSLNGWLYYVGERMFSGATPGIANADINGELILRPYGTFPHPNVLAGYLLIGVIIIASFLIPRSQGFIKYFGIFTIIMSSIAILLSLSRVVIGLGVLLVVGLIIYKIVKRLVIARNEAISTKKGLPMQKYRLLRSFRNDKKKKIGIGLLIAGALDLILFIGGLAFLQTVGSRFLQTSFFEEAFTQRSELIDSALILIRTNPLVGVGLGHFIPSLSPLQEPLSLGLYLQPVHNIFLLIAAETGLIGLGIFLLFLGLTYSTLIKNISLSPLLRFEFLIFSLLLSIILILGLFDHYFLTLQQGQLLFAVILGLSWAKLTLNPKP